MRQKNSYISYIRNSWARYSLHFVPVIYIIYNSTRCVVITLIPHHISVSMVLRIAGKTEGGCSNVSAVGFSWGQSSLSRPRGAKLQGFTGLTADWLLPGTSSPRDTGHNRLFRTTDSDSKLWQQGQRTITSAAGLGCENVLNWDGSLLGFLAAWWNGAAEEVQWWPRSSFGSKFLVVSPPQCTPSPSPYLPCLSLCLAPGRFPESGHGPT